MSKVHLIIPDQHAHPEYLNKRADYVGQLIKDLKPDVVINLGDAADIASWSFKKGCGLPSSELNVSNHTK
jgi:3',5'-cyclic AMP phosphodiesterase CpdA